MKKLLVVVDMQNDFIDGVLGTKEAQDVVPNVVKKINDCKYEYDIVATMDMHDAETYTETIEGKDLPIPHCIINTHGYRMNNNVAFAIEEAEESNPHILTDRLLKNCFGGTNLARYIKHYDYDYVELVGLCTDVCVISNAVIVRNQNPYMRVVVDASCCAGTSPENHKTALAVMKNCGIKIINEE